jgi:uncharacterized protein (TIGR03437 family)
VFLVTLAAAGTLGWGQVRPDWRKVGPSSVELMLASPATGPVDRVWFSGSTLYARTRSGRTLQTADFEAWTPVSGVEPPAQPAAAAVVRPPEPGAAAITTSMDGYTVFGLKRNLYRSEDGGRTWRNLTALKSQSVIGAGQHSVAVSPQDPDQIVVANDYGVWRTMDGGLTWAGLNMALPNLPVRRILSTPTGTAGTRIQVDSLPDALELPPGATVWVPAGPVEDEQARKNAYAAQLGAEIRAYAAAGQTVYAGSNDGRLWFSDDGGATFQPSSPLAGTAAGPVERIYVDPAKPQVAIAALTGNGPHVVRTFNGGRFWDAIDSDLPSAPAHSVAADPASGAVYVATDKGVFWTATDLAASSSPPHWINLSGSLPAEPAYDVRLDPAGVQLYVALDGYGVYATAAPHRSRNVRLINTADFSSRPAAPGSLLSVVGAHVNAARGGALDYPVLGASDTESQVQVPFGAAGPSVALALDTTAGPVTLPVQVQPVSPAIFVSRDGAAMLYDGDSGMPLDVRNPARSNGRVLIFATGLGKLRREWPAGMASPLEDPPAVAAEVKAFLNGAPLQVTRATLAPGYIGFYLVEVQLPVITNIGSSELFISADGQESNRVQVLIEP